MLFRFLKAFLTREMASNLLAYIKYYNCSVKKMYKCILYNKTTELDMVFSEFLNQGPEQGFRVRQQYHLK